MYTYEVAHPILLAKDTLLTRLFTFDWHAKFNHLGFASTLSKFAAFRILDSPGDDEQWFFSTCVKTEHVVACWKLPHQQFLVGLETTTDNEVYE